MKSFVLICGVLLSMTCLAESEQKPLLQRLTGVWEGSGKQDDKSQWTIKITITPDRYLIDYPSLNCGGLLELIKENTESLVFQETLSYGLDRCFDNGKTVLIQAPNNTLRYYWYYENGGKKAAAGKLSRQFSPIADPNQKDF